MNSRNYQISWELTIAKASYCRSPWSVISRYFLAKKKLPSPPRAKADTPCLQTSEKSTKWANLPNQLVPNVNGSPNMGTWKRIDYCRALCFRSAEVMLGWPKAPRDLRSQKPHLPQWNFKSWKKTPENKNNLCFFTHDYIYIHHLLVFNSNNFSIIVGHLFFTFFHCQPSNDRDWPWLWHALWALQLWCCTGFLNITVTDETIGPLDHQWLLQINHHFEWCFTFLKWRHTLLLKTTHIT